MGDLFFGLLLFLVLCYFGVLFGRLAFVYTFERGFTQFCFVTVFALSTFMFTLVLLDASKKGRSFFLASFGSHMLSFALRTNIVVISVVCPICFFWSLLRGLPLSRFIMLLIGSCIFLFAFATWSRLIRVGCYLLNFGVLGNSTVTLWETITTTVVSFGVVAVGILSGYAAVTRTVAFFQQFFVQRGAEKARAALGTLARRQAHLLSLWVAKRRQIALASRATAEATAVAPLDSVFGAGRRALGWVARSLRSTAGAYASFHEANDVARLRAESDGIQAVSAAVFLQMGEMDLLVRSAEGGATWRRSIDAVVGAILVLHVFLKLVFTSISLLRCCMSSVFAYSLQREDTATRMVRFLEAYGLAAPHSAGAEERIAWVSLCLNTWMIVSSIRGFLLTVFRLKTMYTTFLTVDSAVLGLTIGMGAYFLGQLMLLPLSPTMEKESLLSDVLRENLPRSEMYFHLNDFVFLVSSVVTVVMHHWIFLPYTTVLYSFVE